MTSNSVPGRANVSKLRTWIEYLGLLAFLKLMRALPVDVASDVGGWLGRRLGPLSSRHRRALGNLQRVFPDKTEAERKRIALGVWDNAGRVFAEYAHLRRIIDDPARVECVGLNNISDNLSNAKGGFLLTAHYGNFEVASTAALRIGLTQYSLFRPPRNPLVDELLAAQRSYTVKGGLLPKADGNLRQILRLLNENKYIGMVVDQRESRGLVLSFLGQPSTTVHSPALLARRTGVPIFVGRAQRIERARFRLECAHIPVDQTDDWEADVATTTQRINDLMTCWIHEAPEQWMWFHRRW